MRQPTRQANPRGVTERGQSAASPQRLRQTARLDRAASGLVRSVVGRYGFAAAGILTDWPNIAGHRLAAESRPMRLQFPRGGRANGVLHLRVTAGFALEIQHMEPQLVERINQHFGYAAVARLKISQGPVSVVAARRRRASTLVPEGSERAVAEIVAEVSDPQLKSALTRLGTAIAADSQARDRRRDPL